MTMGRSWMALAAAMVVLPAMAGAGEPPGREQIRMLAGCHAVTYHFHEDGAHDYLNPELPPAVVTREYTHLAEDGPERIVLQHAMIGEEGQAMPHWHEEWTHGAGGWTQSVYGRGPGDPERELRSRCTAPWSMNRWACDLGPSPRPFRDSGAPFGFMREDYAELDRQTVLLVTPHGSVHAQDNRKLTEAGDLVSYELRYIISRRFDDARCDEMVTDRSLLEAVE